MTMESVQVKSVSKDELSELSEEGVESFEVLADSIKAAVGQFVQEEIGLRLNEACEKEIITEDQKIALMALMGGDWDSEDSDDEGLEEEE